MEQPEVQETYYCECGEPCPSPAKLGEHIETESGEHSPGKIERIPMSETESESEPADDSDVEQAVDDAPGTAKDETIGWISGRNFVVKRWSKAQKKNEYYAVRFNDGYPNVEKIPLEDQSGKADALGMVVEMQPPIPDTDDSSHYLSAHSGLTEALSNLSLGGGVAQNGAQTDTGDSDSGGGGGDDDSDPVTSTITISHDYDLSQLKESLDIWIDNYADMMDSDLIAGGVHTGQAQATIPGSWDHPEAGQTVVGFEIDHAPWYWKSGPWDGSNNGWDTDDGDAPPEWSDSGSAFMNLVQNKDEILGFNLGENDNGYTEYANFIPAPDAKELTS